MAIRYKQAKKYVGKSVIAVCHDGKQHIGTVEKVTKEGIMLRPHPHHVSGEATLQVSHADGSHEIEAENVFFPGAFLLPFVALASLAPLAAAGAYGGYGPYGGPYYGGYPGGYYGPRRRRRRRRGYPGPYLY
ncbi:MAG TPA: hypothetical protein VFV52_10175 [Bacilli bacterium]|nr:hypothetical protein [Bacilli bacterium]